MKNWLIIAVLMLSLVLAGATACTQSGKDTVAQPLKVTRGDLAITVSGSGTVELSQDMRLTFGTSGRISKLLVKEGERVKAGQVIAVLEADALELSLAQAEVAYAQAQLAVTQNEVAVSQATVAVTQAEINQKSAEIALEQTRQSASVSDVRIAQADVDTAKRNLADSLLTLSKYTPGTPGYEEWQKNVGLAQARLKAAEARLDAILNGFSTDEVAVKEQQVVAAGQALLAAQQSLELAKLNAEVGRQSLELAEKSRDYARKQLDKATLVAPFDGVIASLPVDEKDTVMATTVIAYLADLSSMELKVQIDEIDIPGVKIGQRAIVKVDALPETELTGKVSYISPLARKEAGVTLFDVKIELIDAGNVGLGSGMSASADIVTLERSNVLLVPSRVIKQGNQGENTVAVIIDGKTEERTVTIGISDGFQTEILSGLEEGQTAVERRGGS